MENCGGRTRKGPSWERWTRGTDETPRSSETRRVEWSIWRCTTERVRKVSSTTAEEERPTTWPQSSPSCLPITQGETSARWTTEDVHSCVSRRPRTRGAAPAPWATNYGRIACRVKVIGRSTLMFSNPNPEIIRINQHRNGITFRNLRLFLGVDSFLMYSIHEGIRGIALEPNDNSEALMPITGTLFAVGVDFHAGRKTYHTHKHTHTQSCFYFV